MAIPGVVICTIQWLWLLPLWLSLLSHHRCVKSQLLFEAQSPACSLFGHWHELEPQAQRCCPGNKRPIVPELLKKYQMECRICSAVMHSSSSIMLKCNVKLCIEEFYTRICTWAWPLLLSLSFVSLHRWVPGPAVGVNGCEQHWLGLPSMHSFYIWFYMHVFESLPEFAVLTKGLSWSILHALAHNGCDC